MKVRREGWEVGEAAPWCPGGGRGKVETVEVVDVPGQVGCGDGGSRFLVRVDILFKISTLPVLPWRFSINI